MLKFMALGFIRKTARRLRRNAKLKSNPDRFKGKGEPAMINARGGGSIPSSGVNLTPHQNNLANVLSNPIAYEKANPTSPVLGGGADGNNTLIYTGAGLVLAVLVFLGLKKK